MSNNLSHDLSTEPPEDKVDVKRRLDHPVAQWLWVRVPVRPRSFSAPVAFGGSLWVCARAVSSNLKETTVLAWFRANSVTNLIKQGENVTGRSCGSVAQW